MTPNTTQSEAGFRLLKAIEAAGIGGAKIGYTGEVSDEPYDGASADFDIGESARRVHCYRDDDGAWMIDAMDASVGQPAPHPYGHGILIAYLVWATGAHDDAFGDLDEAGYPGMSLCPECFKVTAAEARS